MENIESSFGNPTPRAKPGDGPGLGEIVVPVGNPTIENFLTICFLYMGVRYVRRKLRIKRGFNS